jgi:6,7-dimethyl-8-ribityllumazine synthase
VSWGAGDHRYAIVVARFYEDIAERLTAGAREAFAAQGAEADVHEVPGAFELPLAVRLCADSGRYAGVAALGCVIRGETDHYEYVCAEAARGIAQVGLEARIPCAFGVLTVETRDQALERSGGGKRHAGREAAEAVMSVAALRRELGGN